MGYLIWHPGIQNTLKTSHVLEQINLKLLPSNFTTDALFSCYFVGIALDATLELMLTNPTYLHFEGRPAICLFFFFLNKF